MASIVTIASSIASMSKSLGIAMNATMGVASLSPETGIPTNSLMRMLSDKGNPRAGNLATILKAIGQNVGVRILVHVEPANELEDHAV